MSILVFGHKNPDTDSVCAAIALADLKKKLGQDIAPAMQGELTPESKFVLEKFNVEAPAVVTSYAGKDVYLVDHSDLAQSPDDLAEANMASLGLELAAPDERMGSSDMGNVSQVVPSMHPYVAIGPEEMGGHTAEFCAAAGSAAGLPAVRAVGDGFATPRESNHLRVSRCFIFPVFQKNTMAR